MVKANLFRVLGHPARVRILELLREGERSVGALQAELELDSGGTSQHLAALRRVGLVESRREGTSVYYRVEDPSVLRPARDGARAHRAPADRAAVDSAGPRSLVIAALLLAGLSAIALGAALVLVHARAFRSGAADTGRGRGRGRACRLLGCSDPATRSGAGFASALDPRFGVDGLSGLFLGTLGLVAATGARLLAPLPAADTTGTRWSPP